MATLNINGHRSHNDEIKLLLNDLEINIIALNETKLDDSINHQVTEIAGFKQMQLDRSTGLAKVGVYLCTLGIVCTTCYGMTSHTAIWNFLVLKFNPIKASPSF